MTNWVFATHSIATEKVRIINENTFRKKFLTGETAKNRTTTTTLWRNSKKIRRIENYAKFKKWAELRKLYRITFSCLRI